jgi:trimethylamine-N-oxide reductase (cytochrome c) cytochrome c-type subunit TorY
MELRTKKSGSSKKKILYVGIPLLVIVLLAAHEVGVRHFQDLTCGVCHEMKDPVAKWK